MIFHRITYIYNISIEFVPVIDIATRNGLILHAKWLALYYCMQRNGRQIVICFGILYSVYREANKYRALEYTLWLNFRLSLVLRAPLPLPLCYHVRFFSLSCSCCFCYCCSSFFGPYSMASCAHSHKHTHTHNSFFYLHSQMNIYGRNVCFRWFTARKLAKIGFGTEARTVRYIYLYIYIAVGASIRIVLDGLIVCSMCATFVAFARRIPWFWRC